MDKEQPLKYSVILDKLPLDMKAETIKKALTDAKFSFKAVEPIVKDDFEKFGIERHLPVARNARFKNNT